MLLPPGGSFEVNDTLNLEEFLVLCRKGKTILSRNKKKSFSVYRPVHIKIEMYGVYFISFVTNYSVTANS